jgi:hypothetical protein
MNLPQVRCVFLALAAAVAGISQAIRAIRRNTVDAWMAFCFQCDADMRFQSPNYRGLDLLGDERW